MTLKEAKRELVKFVKLKTTQQPAFVEVLLNAIPAADVVEAGYKVFAEWVARIIFNGGLEDESFCELACRKLNDLGIVEKTENEWHFDDPCKNITPAYLVDKEDTQ